MTFAQLDPSAQAPCTRTTLTFSCGIGSLLVLRDQLIGDVIQVIADDLWLRADSQDVVAHPLDQGSLPPRSDGAKGVPCVASDKTKLRRVDPEFPLNISIGLPRGLVMLDAICTKTTLEEIDDPAPFELTRLHLRQIVRQRE